MFSSLASANTRTQQERASQELCSSTPQTAGGWAALCSGPSEPQSPSCCNVHITTDEVCGNCPAVFIPWLQSHGTPNRQQYAYDVDSPLSRATPSDPLEIQRPHLRLDNGHQLGFQCCIGKHAALFTWRVNGRTIESVFSIHSDSLGRLCTLHL